MNRERIILWGAGINAKEIMKNLCFMDMFQLVGIIDNSESAWGKSLGNFTVLKPEQIYVLEFDKVVISTPLYFDEIKEQLINELGISHEKIENSLYLTKVKLLCKYRESEDKEIRQVIEQLSHNSLNVFNYPFAKAYDNMPVEVAYDKKVGLYYVIHQGKRMYMAQHLDTEDKVVKYYRDTCKEQDKDSPHIYLDESFQVDEGAVILDAGVGEGNFSLEVIEKASKIYMIESDKEWVEALNYTFAEYKDKVVIINAIISDYTAYDTYKLDDLIQEPVDFIKMDIEGSEIDALKGARKLISKSKNVKCAICTYHNDYDEIATKMIAEDYGLRCEFTRGYMFFPAGIKQKYISPILRRGIARCWKNE